MNNKLYIILYFLSISCPKYIWSQNKFPCDSKLYFFRDKNGSPGGSAFLSYIDRYTEASSLEIKNLFQLDLSLTSGSQNNALAANSLDGLLYYINSNIGFPTGKLISLDADGNQTTVCNFNMIDSIKYGTSVQACFDHLGRYWLLTDGVAMNSYYLTAINITSCNISKGPYLLNLPENTLDICFNPYDCHFYAGNTFEIIKIDMDGNIIDTFYTNISVSEEFGGTAIGEDNKLYALTNNEAVANLYRFNLNVDMQPEIVVTFSPGTGFAGQQDMAGFLCPQYDSKFSTESIVCDSPYTFNITNLSQGNISDYLWNFGDDRLSSDTSKNISHEYITKGKYNISLVAYSKAVCSANPTDTFTLSVKTGNDIHYKLTNDTMSCSGNNILLKIISDNNYNWDSDVSIINTNDSGIYVYTNESKYFYINFSDSSNCQTRDSILLKVVNKPNVFIPNSFTPNGDGINDVLKIQGLMDQSLFTIYDRWGNIQYQTNQSIWDGKINGINAYGNYIYTLETTCANLNILYQGNLTLTE